MKFKKIRVWMVVTLAAAIAVTAMAITGFAMEDGMQSLEDQLLSVSIAAKAERLKIGVIPIDTITPGQRSAQSTQEMLLDAQEAVQLNFGQYYAGNEAARYQQIQDSKGDNLDMTQLEVDSGVLDGCVLQVEDVSDTEKRVHFSCVGWLTTIYQENGQYLVVTAFNRDTVTNVMVLEDGTWKILRTEDHQKEFAPEGYRYEKGCFDTLEEAIDFVRDMDVEAENPF